MRGAETSAADLLTLPSEVPLPIRLQNHVDAR
jgi:hypothetical protein